jgi:hypothetical protein
MNPSDSHSALDNLIVAMPAWARHAFRMIAGCRDSAAVNALPGCWPTSA